MAEHTPTPWLYRPHKHDDWGWIRGRPEEGETVGPIIATARSGKYETPEQWDEHRRNKTDPFEANAAFIVEAVNNHADLVDLVKTLLENDPDYPIADNGMTVLDGWRERARQVLSLVGRLPQGTDANGN